MAANGRQRRALSAGTALAIQVGFLLTCLGLDLRDVIYKLGILGPFDSVTWTTESVHMLGTTPMQSLVTLPSTVRGAPLVRDSGWSSFLDRCEDLTGASDSPHALGRNCLVAPGMTMPQLVLTANQRVDAVAWGACKLLHIRRRPRLCQSRMVGGFLRRYSLPDTVLTRDKLAPEGSAAEKELLMLLGVIAASSPTFEVVCVSAVAHSGKGMTTNQNAYEPRLFGCGSPNVFRSAFAGHDATALAELLEDKAWLSLSLLNIMGLQLRIRQSETSRFIVDQTASSALQITERSELSFATSGQLFIGILVVDVYLVITKFRNAFQLFRHLMLAQFRRRRQRQYQAEANPFREAYDMGPVQYLSLLTRSSYRSRPLAILMACSQLVAWQMMIPNTVIWDMSVSASGRAHALLSALRVWILVEICINWLWDLFVEFLEPVAYRVSRHAHVNVVEFLAISGLAAAITSPRIMDIRKSTHVLGRQRLVDTTSFQGMSMVANAYDDDHELILSTRVVQLGAVYSPLLQVIGLTLLGVGIYVAAKGFLWRHSKPDQKVLAAADDAHPSKQQPPTSSEYSRLALERLLHLPIRAKSLLRAVAEMEIEHKGRHYVHPSVYLDYGLFVDHKDNLWDRVGFLATIPPSVDMATKTRRTASMMRGADTLNTALQPVPFYMAFQTRWVAASRSTYEHQTTMMPRTITPGDTYALATAKPGTFVEPETQRQAGFNVPLR